jgi:hypothetical protein
MRLDRSTAAGLLAVLAALPAAAAGAEPAARRPAATAAKPAEPAFHRVPLNPKQGSGLPYSVELPEGWEVRQVEGFPGLWLGPADAVPPADPRLVWVRGSRTSMAQPERVVANLRAKDEAEGDWSAPVLEIREVDGLRGVLTRMDSGEGEEAQSTLILKLPLASLAVDFVASAPRAEFERQLPLYERILASVRLASAAPK